MTVLAAVILTVLGLAVGSFLNVVIYRVPRGESIASPPSACPHCGHAVRWKDNIPVISWLVLRGQCRDCQWPIPRRYVLVEVANAAAWWVLAIWAVSTDSLGLLPWLLVLASACVALTIIDLEHFRLPNAIVYPLYPLLLVGLVASALVDGEVRWGVGSHRRWHLARCYWRYLAAHPWPRHGFGGCEARAHIGRNPGLGICGFRS